MSESESASAGWSLPELMERSPRQAVAIRALVDELRSGECSRERLKRLVVNRCDLTPKSVNNLLLTLARFGLVVRLGVKNSSVDLTFLGRRWLDSDEGRALLGAPA